MSCFIIGILSLKQGRCDVMVKVDKIKTQFGDEFRISTDEGTFRIFFGGNLDLYWSCFYKGNILNSDDEKEFYVTMENYYLFSLVDDLYNRIKNYEVIDVDDVFCYGESFSDSYDRYIQFKESLKRSDEINNNRPFIDNGIEWHSDDSYYDDASVLRIEKVDDVYKIIFKKGKEGIFATYTVRFRNSGSRYDPYNVLFMKMYNKLCLYDPEFHQIHMEEYLYQKKLVRDRKNRYQL